MSNIAQRRRIFKEFKNAMELPDPMRSYEDYLQSRNDDLAGMNRLELRRAWNAAEAKLLLLGDNDLILFIEHDGGQVTARTYLLGRLAAIKRLWKGVA